MTMGQKGTEKRPDQAPRNTIGLCDDMAIVRIAGHVMAPGPVTLKRELNQEIVLMPFMCAGSQQRILNAGFPLAAGITAERSDSINSL